MTYMVSISHIDTCLPCYLQDHHTRDGEVLLGVPVNANTTYRDVLDGLRSEWDGADLYDLEGDEAAIEAVETAFNEEFKAAEISVKPERLFNPTLEDADEDGEDVCYAWFLITYEHVDASET